MARGLVLVLSLLLAQASAFVLHPVRTPTYFIVSDLGYLLYSWSLISISSIDSSR